MNSQQKRSQLLLFGKSGRSFLKVHDELTSCRFGTLQAFAWNFVGIGICPFWTCSFPTLHHKSQSRSRKRCKRCNLRFSFLSLFFYLQIHCCHGWLAALQTQRRSTRLPSLFCLFARLSAHAQKRSGRISGVTQ